VRALLQALGVNHARLSLISLISVTSALGACVAQGPDGTAPDDLTSVDGIEHVIDFDAFVDVAPGTPDGAAKDAIHRQLKSALGALREQGIGVADRDAVRTLAAIQLVRTRMTIRGGGELERVRYHYHDQALVERTQLPTGPVDLTLLYGDYPSRSADLQPACVDEATDADSLWYHYAPKQAACRTRIVAEQNAINAEKTLLTDPVTQIGQADANRVFLATRATLTPVAAAPAAWPEHDQLWGFAGDTSRTKLVVYSFFGVNADEADPADLGLVEYLRFQRTLRTKLPALRVTETNPNAWLLDFYIDGQKLPNIGWADVENWVVDNTGFPAAIGADAAKRADLLHQVQVAFSERWIVWSMPVHVTRNGVERQMTVEIRTWHGWEDGSPEIRQRARWRYLEAFWNADVFAYTGHSHFGHGPLEPWEYSGANFPDRYQVLLFNSCLSFNYYDEDFLAMHPHGKDKLDVVVNGLPAYWQGMGQASASYLVGVLSGAQSWKQILGAMAVNLPWQAGYDPMRAVNGELGNVFNPSSGAISVGP
jgi:hypothetical protein